MVENDVKRVPGEDGTLTDEEIAALQPDAEEAAEEYEKEKERKVEEILATKDLLFKDRKKPFNLKVDVGDKVLIFKVKRLSERERSQLNKINNIKFGQNLEDLTPEQIEELKENGYRIMAEMIVEPSLTVDEWKMVADSALLNHLSNKVSILTTEVNDAMIIEEFKKK